MFKEYSIIVKTMEGEFVPIPSVVREAHKSVCLFSKTGTLLKSKLTVLFGNCAGEETGHGQHDDCEGRGFRHEDVLVVCRTRNKRDNDLRGAAVLKSLPRQLLRENKDHRLKYIFSSIIDIPSFTRGESVNSVSNISINRNQQIKSSFQLNDGGLGGGPSLFKPKGPHCTLTKMAPILEKNNDSFDDMTESQSSLIKMRENEEKRKAKEEKELDLKVV